MKIQIIFFCIISTLSGCASYGFGNTKKELGSLTPKQKKEIKSTHKKEQERKHEDEMRNKFINDIFGTRSDQF